MHVAPGIILTDNEISNFIQFKPKLIFKSHTFTNTKFLTLFPLPSSIELTYVGIKLELYIHIDPRKNTR